METDSTSSPTTVTVVSEATTSSDGVSGIIGSTIPGSSRIVALFSILPVGLVILGLLVWCCVSSRRNSKATKRFQTNQPRWKPTSLQCPTLLILLGLIVTLIVLLESASLALPRGGTSEETQPANYIRSAAVQAGILGARSTSHDRKSILNGIFSRGEPTAPPPSIGWLSLNGDAWLSPELVYFIGTFLPTLVASIFAIPWKILDLETKSLEPFAQLARPGGGRASQTLLLQYNGVSGLGFALRSLFTGHSAVTLSTVLKYSAALLTPLAAQSVRLTLQGECLQDWTKHCTATLEASNTMIRIAQALLVVMGCVVVAYIFLLRGKLFGVTSDPRSILGISSLSLNPYLTAVMRRTSLGPDGMFSTTQAAETLGEQKLEFGYITYPSGDQQYCITVMGNVAEAQTVNFSRPKAKDATPMSDPPPLEVDRGTPNRAVFFWILAKVISFAIFIIGLMILVLYYRLTYNDSGFERFMDSQSAFGVRFLFTVFGVVIGFGWASIFNGKYLHTLVANHYYCNSLLMRDLELARILPVWNMSRHPMEPKDSILMPLSPNPYVGLKTYLVRGHKLLALISVVTILSDFLPIVLANVPFNNAITWITFNVCTWVSVGVLGFMLAVLAIVASVILFSSPSHHFPFVSTDLDTLAAILYLVCRSGNFLSQLQGLSVVGKAQVEKRTKTLNSKYGIISVVGEDGSPHVTIQVTS